MTSYEFFKYGSVFSPIVPLLFLWGRRLTYNQFVIVVFIAVSFSSDLFSNYVLNPRGGNYGFMQLYGIVEASILSYFYWLVLDNARRFITISFFCYAAFYTIDSFYWEAGTFNQYARSIECLLMVTYSFILFYRFYQKEEDIYIEQSPMFWINVALLTYFSGAFISFVFGAKFMPGASWKFHNSANMLKNLLLAVALWRVPRK